MNEEEFRQLAKEKGYGEIELKEVSPGPEQEMHAHDHSMLYLVLNGKFIMTTHEGTKVFIPAIYVKTLRAQCTRKKRAPREVQFY